MTKTRTRTLYLTEQQTLTRHAVVELHAEDGVLYAETRCGLYLGDYNGVSRNLTTELAGWWAGCWLCGTPTTRPSYLDDDGPAPVVRQPGELGGPDPLDVFPHRPASCNCDDCRSYWAELDEWDKAGDEWSD